MMFANMSITNAGGTPNNTQENIDDLSIINKTNICNIIKLVCVFKYLNITDRQLSIPAKVSFYQYYTLTCYYIIYINNYYKLIKKMKYDSES